MVVREQTLVAITVEEIRTALPFQMMGLDVDNDSAFINQTVVDYCKERGLELTRSRAYKKNDQAWIEQKNGAVVRRLVGYGRLEGAKAATALGKLHEIARLYVNFFQPSFKLKSKTRLGAKVIKKIRKAGNAIRTASRQRSSNKPVQRHAAPDLCCSRSSTSPE
jgi:hypothetical protein